MSFLIPHIVAAPKYTQGQYKSLVQQYAQARHMQPVYEPLGVTGPLHAPRYACMVSVGIRKATGNASKKKAAEAEAARAFVRTFGLTPQEEKKRDLSKSASDVPSGETLSRLEVAARALSLPQDYLSAKEFQEAFTHISYEMDHPGCSSNAVLGTIGSFLLNMLCVDYIEQELEIGKVPPEKVRIALTQETVLARTAPPELLPAVRCGRSLFGEDHVNTDAIKATAIKSCVAALWVKSVRKRDMKYADAARDFAYVTFESAIPFAATVNQQQGSPQHKPAYTADATVEGNNLQVRATKTGSTKKGALIEADKDALLQVVAAYPDNGYLDGISRRMKMSDIQHKKDEAPTKPLETSRMETAASFAAEEDDVESALVPVDGGGAAEKSSKALVAPAARVHASSDKTTQKAAKASSATPKIHMLVDGELQFIAARIANEKRASLAVQQKVVDLMAQLEGMTPVQGNVGRPAFERALLDSLAAYVVAHPSKYGGDDYGRRVIKKGKAVLGSWKVNDRIASLVCSITIDMLQDLGLSSLDPTMRGVAVGTKAPGQKKAQKKPEEVKLTHPSTVAFDGPENVLYISKGTVACRRKGHKISSATGILASLNGEPIKINVNHCENCRKYFIDQSEYEHYRARYGALLGNFSFTSHSSGYSGGYDNLADKSILKLCGYSVSQVDGLSEQNRHSILANMLDRGIVDKPRMMSYLKFFIRTNQHRANMDLACDKWKDDLEFVRGYHIDRQRHFVVKSVRRYR